MENTRPRRETLAKKETYVKPLLATGILNNYHVHGFCEQAWCLSPLVEHLSGFWVSGFRVYRV